MTAGIYAELSSDEKSIFLAVTGDSWELDRAAKALRKLTMEARRTDPPTGLLELPCTYAAVTQLAFTFNNDSIGRWLPQARLRAWITEEFLRRNVVRAYPADVIIPAGRTPRPYQYEAASMINAVGKFLLLDEAGPQPVTTPVWTSDGWRELGDLVPGDIVYDSSGQPVPIRTVKHFGEQPVYRVTFSDRTSTLATGNHRWHVFTKNDRYRENGGRIVTTDELRADRLIRGSGDGNGAWFFLPQQPVMQIPSASLPLDPYAYGALLGDGSLGSEQLSIACPDNEILLRVAAAATALGTSWKWATPDDRCQSLRFHRDGKLRIILSELKALTRSEGKSIHSLYLRACASARRMLLAGLLDTDGSVIHTGAAVEYSSASPKLAADVAWLARSLGAVVTESSPQPAGYIKGGIKTWTLDRHRLTIRFSADGPNPFTLPRKADAWHAQALRVQRRNPPRSFQSVEPAGTAEVCCIELDAASTRVYLTDTTLIPTHNTGKTCSVILGLKARQLAHGIFPLIIVTPSWEVCEVWAAHIADWAPDWPTAVMYGGTGRGGLLGKEILLTTYATATLDAADAKGPLVKLKARAVICDESHAIKNEKAKRTSAVQRIAGHAATFVGMSGTQITRDTGDIFPVLAAMDPRSYPARGRFVKRYLDTSDNGYGETVEGLSALREPEFRAALQGQMRRVAKADVLPQLPPKIYSVRRVEIPGEWRHAYRTMEQDMLAELPDDQELPVMSTLAQLTRLGQLASSACDVVVREEVDPETGELKKHYEVTLKAPSWKADSLCGILAERPGQQTAVFANSKQLILIAADAATKQGYRCGLLVGGQSAKERRDDIAAFQAGELDLILCTAGAGGLGVTLTAAGTVVMLQRSYELDKAVQPEDRAHRLDDIVLKHEAIEIIDVVAKDTVEERARALIRVKGAALGQLVQDPRVVRELLGGLK